MNHIVNNKKQKSRIGIMVCCAVIVLIPGLVFAGSTTNKGANPNGKPFIEINGQIVEVQNDISTLEANYNAIKDRVQALEDLDLQGQIDAINAEIVALELIDASLQTQISDLAAASAAAGSNIDFLLLENSRILTEIDTLTTATGDNTAAIDTLIAELAVVAADIAAIAPEVVTALANSEQNADTIAMLLSDVADLQNDIAAMQYDITGTCPAGTAVTTVNDNGTLECAFANTLGEIVSYRTYSGSFDLDRYSYCRYHYHSFGYRHCHYYTVSGSRSAEAYCPSGYTIAGGGFWFTDHNTGNVRVRQSTSNGPSRWYVWFDNLSSSATNGYRGGAYANCVKAN